MNPQLEEDVLDVRPCRLGTDHQSLSDALVVRSTREKAQNLALPPRKLCQAPVGGVLCTSPADQQSEQRTQHLSGDESLPAVDRPRGLQQLRQWAFLREEAVGTRLDGLHQGRLVLLGREDQDPTRWNTLLDEGRRTYAIAVRQCCIEQSDIGKPSLRLRHCLQPVTRVGNDFEIRLILEDGPDRLPEQGMAVGQKYLDLLGVVQCSRST